MTEQREQSGGGVQGDPNAQPPAPNVSPRATNPLLALYPPPPSAEFAEVSGGKRSLVLWATGLLALAAVAAGVGYFALSGATMLMPRSAEARAEEMAKDPRAVAAAKAQVVVLRGHIVLYRLQHNDKLPTLSQLRDGWSVLVSETKADGSLADEPPAGAQPGKRRSAVYGPYLNELPVNPLTKSSKVAAVGKATLEDGFTYDPRTGKVSAVTIADTEETRREEGYFELVK